MDGRTVVVGVCEEPDVLVQDFSLRHVTWAVLSPLMLKLVRYDDRWRAWPELAREIPSRVALPDGRVEMTWRLRDDVRWHDGEPVTAADALFAYELLKATPPPYPHHTIVEAISEMLAPDPHTLIVRWNAGERFAMDEEWGTVLPRHLLAGEGLEREDVRARHPFLRAPTFHGPYRFAEWEPGSHIELRAAAAHPCGLPEVERIQFRFFDGPGELRAAVIDGTVDVTDLTGFSPADAAAIERAAPDIDVHETSSFTWEHIDLNLDDPVLADVRVRRALAHAIDRREISERLYEGRCPPARSWLPERHPAYNPAIAEYEHDPAAARALLRAAGHRRLALHLVTTPPPEGGGGLWTSSATRARVAAILREQLARVGVDLEVELVPAADLFPRVRRRDYRQLALFAWSMGLETTGFLLWHSSKIPLGLDWYGLNVSGWRDAENDRLLDRVADADAGEDRYALMREQQALWAQCLPALPLFFPPAVTTANPALRNIKPVGAFNAYITWNSWEWSWDRAALSLARAASSSAAPAMSPR